MNLCPQKNICGSCGWSHIPYELQMRQKLSDINGSFTLKKLNLECKSIIASPKTEHYRNRMDFVIDFEGRVGLREKGKWWKVIDYHTCFLADERIDEIFCIVRDWTKTAGLSFYDRKAHTGLLRYAVIRATRTGETMINVVTSATQTDDEAQKIRSALLGLAQISNASTVIWSQNKTITDISFGEILETISGHGFITETISGMHYRVSPNAFFQTNSHAAPLLLKTVMEFCGDLSNKTVLDLYCGTGFFSIALAPQTKKIIGIEMNTQAIEDARSNAHMNQVPVNFIDAKTEKFDWTALHTDMIILDPPRSGMHDKVLADILAVRPQVIIYISCNPKNFAREMVQLQKHYTLDRMQAIDMFPHTPHVELVTLLHRRI